MSITLRPYQQAAVDAVRSEIGDQLRAGLKASAILESPTGSGKTAMSAFIADSAVKKGGSVAFICHRKELIDQTALTFDKVGLDYGFLASGYEERAARVQICSIGTLARRVDRISAPTLCIWDECHHVGAKTWAETRETWVDSIHLGLTATPQRLDGKGLGHWFNALVPGPSVKELMRDGYLSTWDGYAPVTPKLAGIHMRGGDYARGELESALDVGSILGGIVDNWKKLADGRKTIGFAITVDHSEHIVQAFRDAGVRAQHLDAKTPKVDRRKHLQAFARGEIEVLFNVELFGEGFDLAANSGMDVNIEAVILARPTASLGLHLQQVGRALRPKPEPAIILDHAGNMIRHGYPEEERSWSLDDKEVQQSEPSMKICQFCFAIIARHLDACPYCGSAFPKAPPREIDVVEGTLERIASGALTAEKLKLELFERRRAVTRARSLADLKRLQQERGLPEGWAEDVMRRRVEQAQEGRRF